MCAQIGPERLGVNFRLVRPRGAIGNTAWRKVTAQLVNDLSRPDTNCGRTVMNAKRKTRELRDIFEGAGTRITLPFVPCSDALEGYPAGFAEKGPAVPSAKHRNGERPRRPLGLLF